MCLLLFIELLMFYYYQSSIVMFETLFLHISAYLVHISHFSQIAHISAYFRIFFVRYYVINSNSAYFCLFLGLAHIFAHILCAYLRIFVRIFSSASERIFPPPCLNPSFNITEIMKKNYIFFHFFPPFLTISGLFYVFFLSFDFFD